MGINGSWGAVQDIPASATPATPTPLLLKHTALRQYIDHFNAADRELYSQFITNGAAADFLQTNVPLLECPDKELEEIYYFRWWTFRKHLKQTPDGFIVTEFLPPVDWAGKYNSISCAGGHHFYEGRWLNDSRYLDDYSVFWFRKGGKPRIYSFWVANALWSRFLVTGDDRLFAPLLPDLIQNYEAREKERRDANGLYWQADGQDGMEVSISGALNPRGEGYRVTMNSYQYGDALAIAHIAERLGQIDVVKRFRAKAAELQSLVQDQLWDPEAQFFKVRPRNNGAKLSDARELHGYTPWYFNLPAPDKSVAWKQLMDPKGFFAPFGPTTAEQRHPGFHVTYQGHECQWNGPSWPYATAVTLTALANLIDDYPPAGLTSKDYFELLRIYAHSHHLRLDDGRVVPWIDENLNPTNGDWLARTRLKSWKNGQWDRSKGGEERGKDYNHSTFCDLVISGLIGLRPRSDDLVEVRPLVPETWDYFCLDQVRYHGHWLTILWDKTGEHYGRGVGLRLFADGQPIANRSRLGRLQGTLPGAATQPPETSAGWKKFEANPIMGGKYGTCFDISVLRETNRYRMWLSWRPQRSVALVESTNGIHWSEPPQIALGPRPGSGWEDEINRPVVLRRDDGYHMWYTGQTRSRSWIGYATSADGVTWKRQSDTPVLAPQAPWEKVAVMCPHVLWDDRARIFRMWYSGGDQYEPDAIGYASSPDGHHWTRHPGNPVFQIDPGNEWERHKVTACQVVQQGDWFLMFYIGFQDVDHAQIGVARSHDGLTQWQRHPLNPIIRPGRERWDHDACYKPYAIFDGSRWLLWYNGRHGHLEQIGVVLHDGEDLGFD